MKTIKWILYIVLALVALVLIIPLFLPATVRVTAEQDVPVTPAQVFHNAASYTDRNMWDPWLVMDPEAEVVIEPSTDYTGSRYYWNGKKIKTGQMIVDSVVYARYIASEIRFGDDPEPSLVEWNLEPTRTGTHIEWSFTARGDYPIERIMLNVMKGGMRSSFEDGLDNFARYIEQNPPALSSLGSIEYGSLAPMDALVVMTQGTMEQMAGQIAEMYGKIMQAIEAQGLQMGGIPFTHYLTYDPETGITGYLAGMPVSSRGRDQGDVKAKSYPEIQTIQAVHTGPYEELALSYGKFEEYLRDNRIEVTGEAFEFYMTDPGTEPLATKWQTLIVFPLK